MSAMPSEPSGVAACVGWAIAATAVMLSLCLSRHALAADAPARGLLVEGASEIDVRAAYCSDVLKQRRELVVEGATRTMTDASAALQKLDGLRARFESHLAARGSAIDLEATRKEARKQMLDELADLMGLAVSCVKPKGLDTACMNGLRAQSKIPEHQAYCETTAWLL